mgnify:CR=1 FL=1
MNATTMPAEPLAAVREGWGAALSRSPNGDELFPKRYDIIHPSGQAYDFLARDLLLDMAKRGWVHGAF